MKQRFSQRYVKREEISKEVGHALERGLFLGVVGMAVLVTCFTLILFGGFR
jgi:hypothetical protein